MTRSRTRLLSTLFSMTLLSSLIAFQPATAPPPGPLIDPFAPGRMVADTNGDGLIDAITGKVVVPDDPTAAENAAAANIAARLGYLTTGLTPPVVIRASADRGDGPRIWIGAGAVPQRLQTQLSDFTKRLEASEGGVFALGQNLAVVGKDDGGLQAAAEALASRAPFIWKIPGDRLTAITEAVPGGRLDGVTYLKDKAGINRALLAADVAPAVSALDAALATPKLGSVHELIVNGSVSAVSSKSLAAIPRGGAGAGAAGGAAPAAAAGAGGAGGEGAAAATPQGLDLASLYTMRGLFRGSPRMPIPSTLDSQLYVPAGKAGVAMANLAARMGLESTGVTLPLAVAAPGVTIREIRTKAVVTESSDAGKEAARKLKQEDTVADRAETPLAAGEGEARVVDKAFGRNAAVLLRGDDEGATAALGLLSDHFPNLWEQGKQHLSIEEIRYDMHRFFSLRSAPGQASVALYRLEKWMDEIKRSGEAVKNVEAKVFVDLADAGLAPMIRKQIADRLGNVGNPSVTTGSLRAGTQCCEKTPALHYQEPGYKFQQGKPAFAEDIVIPWEGTRLLNAVQSAVTKVKAGAPARLVARVSEGPEQRLKLRTQLADLLTKAGAKDPEVSVICAYKSGYSWLMDEIAPQLKPKPVASMKIEFKKNEDPTQMRAMFSPARWVHELYPVDEDLARTLNIPLSKIELAMFEGGKQSPTYRVHAYDSSGKELLARDFTVSTVMQSYNGVMKSYEQVEVDTGWVRLESGGAAVLDQRIPTDIEQFWDHYQNQTLPRIHKAILSQAHGEIRPEYAPMFDTLRIDIHMSEPNYMLGIDKELISSLEALQEDTFYSTENFVNMIGDLQAGRPIVHVGRIIPIVHASDDGKDGHVRIEFYQKPAANPQVELSWTGADGKRHRKHRDLPALNGAFQPRLVQARVRAGGKGPESLTWILGADFKNDEFEEWAKLEGENQIEHSIFPVEQAAGQMRWLEAMHAAGMYANDLSYPYIKRMNIEFSLPRPLTVKVDSPEPREFATWTVQTPKYPRPMISDYKGKLSKRVGIVQWDEPIPPSESAAVLAKLAEYPGVNVYWMGRSYLGIDLWAADVTTPSSSLLRSWAKETTLKGSVIYSGRQHANEVSSTSHILKLGEQLVTDPETKAMLKQVNVVLHPITNTDGADLSVQLAEITPNNMLHPGYHGALAADVAVGGRDVDPLYPESRTRKLLQDAWLPDTFLNPHGYPSHEWVQPFSEYSGWVQSRQGANPGRSWWIPRGWFTSLSFSRDPNQPYSEKIANEIKDRIADAQNAVPGLMDLEARMNDRYQRFGQRWQPRDMQQPLTKGVRIYMSLKGGGNRGGGGEAPPADITWNAGYTEAPDETAHGDYMKLMASAGLAFDRVHLKYLADGKLRIQRTEREQGPKVTWSVQRLRPNLPAGETEPPRPDQASGSEQ